MSAHHAATLPAGSLPHLRLGALLAAKVADAGGYLWALGAAAIASGWWTVTRAGAADGLVAEDLAALRFGIAGLLLLPLAWRDRAAILRMRLRTLFFLVVGAGAPYVLVAGTGVRLAPAGIGGAITVGLIPVFTLMLSALFLRERVTRPIAIGIGCIIAGAATVAAGAWSGGGGMLGLAFFCAGALMWSGYTVALRRAGLRPLTAAAVVCVASLVLYVPFWLTTPGPTRLLAAAPSDLLFQTLYQSLLSSIGTLYCFGRAVARLGATRTSVFAAIVPTFSVVIAAVFLGESPGGATLGGALLLSAGAVIAARPRKAVPANGASHAHPAPSTPAQEDEMHEIHMPMHTAPGAGALSRWVGRTYAGWRRGQDVARTRLVLSELPDATLRDIGLRRFELGGIASDTRFTSRF